MVLLLQRISSDKALFQTCSPPTNCPLVTSKNLHPFISYSFQMNITARPLPLSRKANEQTKQLDLSSHLHLLLVLFTSPEARGGRETIDAATESQSNGEGQRGELEELTEDI